VLPPHREYEVPYPFTFRQRLPQFIKYSWWGNDTHSYICCGASRGKQLAYSNFFTCSHPFLICSFARYRSLTEIFFAWVTQIQWTLDFRGGSPSLQDHGVVRTSAHLYSWGSSIAVPDLAEFACRRRAVVTIFMFFVQVLTSLLDGSHLFHVGRRSVSSITGIWLHMK